MSNLKRLYWNYSRFSLKIIGLALFITALTLLAVKCTGKGVKQQPPEAPIVDYSQVATPDFNADSAYGFVKNQVDMGFRHPGTKGHAACADYIAKTMRRWCDTVIVQPFTTTLWNGQTVEGKNIIASIAPERERRILLAAHWDSRQWADHDLDTTKWRSPLLGANDGASGSTDGDGARYVVDASIGRC